MKYTDFSFVALNKRAKNFFYFEDSKQAEYSAGAILGKSFIEIATKNIVGSNNNGWKFHLSIDDQDQNNLAKAWNMVVDILIDCGVEGFKVCKENIHMADAIPKACEKYKYAQRGKQITIYDSNNVFRKDRKKSWEEILSKITVEFVKNKIKPSYVPPYDKRIPGSSFISYRNDTGLKGSKRSTEYNPSKEKDPFAKINLSHIEGQPNAPKWQSPEKKSKLKPNLTFCFNK